MVEGLLEKAREEVLARVGKKYFGEGLGSEQQEALRYFFEEMLHELKRAERSVFLENDGRNKGHGYYQRDLVTGKFLGTEREVPTSGSSSPLPPGG